MGSHKNSDGLIWSGSNSPYLACALISFVNDNNSVSFKTKQLVRSLLTAPQHTTGSLRLVKQVYDKYYAARLDFYIANMTLELTLVFKTNLYLQ